VRAKWIGRRRMSWLLCSTSMVDVRDGLFWILIATSALVFPPHTLPPTLIPATCKFYPSICLFWSFVICERRRESGKTMRRWMHCSLVGCTFTKVAIIPRGCELLTLFLLRYSTHHLSSIVMTHSQLILLSIVFPPAALEIANKE
jgi:hypothetical protein